MDLPGVLGSQAKKYLSVEIAIIMIFKNDYLLVTLWFCLWISIIMVLYIIE